MADFVEMGRDELCPVAPRTILRRQIEHIENAGFTPQVASELEFALYRGTYDDGRSNGYETLRSDNARARRLHGPGRRPARAVLRERPRGARRRPNLGPWTSQVEWGLGQWEINLEYQRALEMADRHILFKLAMRDLASAAGMAVTFMPKPFGDTTGSSCHLHLSLVNASGTNVFHDGDGENGVSASLLQAVGGVLQRAPDVMLFYAPTVNAYRRTTVASSAGTGSPGDRTAVWCRVACSRSRPSPLAWSGGFPARTSTRISRSLPCSRRRATASGPTQIRASR